MEYKKKTFFIYGIILLISLSVFTISTLPKFTTSNSQSESINYKGTVCVYKPGEEPVCSHNVLYNKGKNMSRDCFTSGGCGAVLNITLCNATAGCTTPVADESETYNTFTGCGLAASEGTYTELPQTGNWTVTHTFTSTCDGLEVNATRLTNGTDNFAGNSFTKKSLDTSEQLIINWTLSQN